MRKIGKSRMPVEGKTFIHLSIHPFLHCPWLIKFCNHFLLNVPWTHPLLYISTTTLVTLPSKGTVTASRCFDSEVFLLVILNTLTRLTVLKVLFPPIPYSETFPLFSSTTHLNNSTWFPESIYDQVLTIPAFWLTNLYCAYNSILYCNQVPPLCCRVSFV